MFSLVFLRVICENNLQPKQVTQAPLKKSAVSHYVVFTNFG